MVLYQDKFTLAEWLQELVFLIDKLRSTQPYDVILTCTPDINWDSKSYIEIVDYLTHDQLIEPAITKQFNDQELCDAAELAIKQGKLAS